MSRQTPTILIGAVLLLACVAFSPAFVAAPPLSGREGSSTGVAFRGSQRLQGTPEAAATASIGFGGALAVAGIVAVAALAGKARRSASAPATTFVPLSSSVAAPSSQVFVRDSLVACRAQLTEAGAPPVEETDRTIEELEAIAKRTIAGAASAMVFMGSMADCATAYPIFAQQNYKEPREATGKIACANCHLASKIIDARLPHDVLPDTIFKVALEVPAKYEKREQPVADGSKAKMNIGAIAIFPEGWKLAPKDRLPKPIKKEMKGLAWSPYSKEKPNIFVAGPVPGNVYGEKMIIPILAPKVDEKTVFFDKSTVYFGGNRGRGQVYPEGNQSNNNQFFAPASGTVSAITGSKVSITKSTDGSEVVKDCLPGADIVVTVGEAVKDGDPITTNPNVGGFGQQEADIVLQDMNREYAYCAFAISIFLAQLMFVLKKKQFEKVQLAEGF